MKTFAKNMLIGLTVLGLGTASLAARADDTTTAPAGRHGHAAMGQAQMQAKMAEMWAKRQQKLHDLLKLTSAQEGAWSTYQAAIKPAAPAAGAHPDRAAFAALSAPDRLSKMIDMSKQHETAMEAHLAALNTFYGQLTADQKTIFNDNTMGGKNAHHGHGRWGRHG